MHCNNWGESSEVESSTIVSLDLSQEYRKSRFANWNYPKTCKKRTTFDSLVSVDSALLTYYSMRFHLESLPVLAPDLFDHENIGPFSRAVCLSLS